MQYKYMIRMEEKEHDVQGWLIRWDFISFLIRADVSYIVWQLGELGRNFKKFN